MRVLDYSPIPFDAGQLSFQDRLNGIFKHGFYWVSEMKSQEVVVSTLSRVLDNRFILLRNLPLPEGGVTVPLVLLGPHGILMIYNSPLRGVYRATGDKWEIMDNRMKSFKPTRPNLLTRTALMTKAFGTFLGECGYDLETDGILVFTDPGIHVNTNRPDIRIILMDAIERFATQLLQVEPVLTLEDARAVIESIEIALQPEEEEVEERKRIIPHQQVAQSVDSGFLKMIAPLQQTLNFSERQWMLLSVFVVADVLILIIFLVFLLLTA